MRTRTTSLTLLATAGLLCLGGCGASNSGSENWTYIPIETIPDSEYLAIGDVEPQETTADSSGVQFRGDFQPANTAYSTHQEFRYFYWPSQEVYFAPDRNLYFWQASENQWRFGEELPASVKLSGAERETFVLYTDVPFSKHDKIRLAYPAGGMLTNVSEQADH